MYRHEHCLTPISEPILPPPHTKVHVKCFTCKKFPVCNIRADYLRTALLMENILGRPCENLELHCLHPDFKGISIPFAEKYMPEKITTEVEKEGTFFALKAEDVNNYNFVYGVDKCQIMFSAEYIPAESGLKTTFDNTEFFKLLPLSDFTYPPQTDGSWHYLPVASNILLTDYKQATEIIDSIEEGKFSVTIPISFDVVFGNFDGTGRYPTEEEYTEDPSLIKNAYVLGYLVFPLSKTKDGITVYDEICFKSRGDSAEWFQTFGNYTRYFSLEDSKKIFEYLYTIKKEAYFEISEGTDLFYKNIKSEISSDDKDLINEALLEIRDIILSQQPTTKINTTAFHADLQCKFYEWEKGLNEEEGIKRLMLKYPHGIPIDDKEYYHLETIHIEPGNVPCYHPFNGTPTFMPMPYPVYIPPKCEHQTRYATRDEINEI